MHYFQWPFYVVLVFHLSLVRGQLGLTMNIQHTYATNNQPNIPIYRAGYGLQGHGSLEHAMGVDGSTYAFLSGAYSGSQTFLEFQIRSLTNGALSFMLPSEASSIPGLILDSPSTPLVEATIITFRIGVANNYDLTNVNQLLGLLHIACLSGSTFERLFILVAGTHALTNQQILYRENGVFTTGIYTFISPTTGDSSNPSSTGAIGSLEDEGVTVSLVLGKTGTPYPFPGNWTVEWDVTIDVGLQDQIDCSASTPTREYRGVIDPLNLNRCRVFLTKDELDVGEFSVFLPTGTPLSTKLRVYTAVVQDSFLIWTADRSVLLTEINDPPTVMYVGRPLVLRSSDLDQPLNGTFLFADEEVLRNPTYYFEITFRALGWGSVALTIPPEESFVGPSSGETVIFNTDPGRVTQIMDGTDVLITPVGGVAAVGEHVLEVIVSDLGSSPGPAITHSLTINVTVVLPNYPVFLELVANDVANQAIPSATLGALITDEDGVTFTVDLAVAFGVLSMETIPLDVMVWPSSINSLRVRGPASSIQATVSPGNIFFQTTHNQTGPNSLTVFVFDHGGEGGMNRTNTSTFTVFGRPSLEGTRLVCLSQRRLSPPSQITSGQALACTLQPALADGTSIWVEDDFEGLFDLSLDGPTLAAGGSVGPITYDTSQEPPVFTWTLMAGTLNANTLLTSLDLTWNLDGGSPATDQGLSLPYLWLSSASVAGNDLTTPLPMTLPGQLSLVGFEPPDFYYIVDHQSSTVAQILLEFFSPQAIIVTVQWNDDLPFQVDLSQQALLNLTIANGRTLTLQDHPRRSRLSQDHRHQHGQNHLPAGTGYNVLILTQLDTTYTFNFDCPLSNQVLCGLDVVRAGGPLDTVVDWVSHGGGHWIPTNQSRSLFLESYVTDWALVPYAYGLIQSMTLSIDGGPALTLDNNAISTPFPSPAPGSDLTLVCQVDPDPGSVQVYTIVLTRLPLQTWTRLSTVRLDLVDEEPPVNTTRLLTSSPLIWMSEPALDPVTGYPSLSHGPVHWVGNVSKQTTAVTLTLTVPNLDMSGLTVTGGGQSGRVLSSSGDPSPWLVLGPRGSTTTLTVTATAEDGVTSTDYTFFIHRGPDSSVDELASLVLIDGQTSEVLPWIGEQDWDPATDVWSAAVDSSVSSLAFLSQVDDSIQSVTIEGTGPNGLVLTPPGGQSLNETLTLGEEGTLATLTVTITAEDGHTRTLTVYVERRVTDHVDWSVLPFAFGPISITDQDHLSTWVSVPYTDWTWREDPALSTRFDPFLSMVWNTSVSHPVLMTYIDLVLDGGGAGLIPRNETDAGSCSTLNTTGVASILDGRPYDAYLWETMVGGQSWITADHPGQKLFQTELFPPPAGGRGWPVGSEEARTLENPLTLLSVSQSVQSLIVGLEPWTDDRGRHQLTFHLSLSLADFLLCTASRQNDGSHRRAVNNDHFVPTVINDGGNTQYTFFLSAIGLEPQNIAGERGGLRGETRSMSVAVSPWGLVSEVSGSGRTIFVSLSDAAVVSGAAFGCSPDHSDARIIMDLDILHLKDSTFDQTPVVGIRDLAHVLPDDGDENDNCYGFPVSSEEPLFSTQSIDNWSLVSGRLATRDASLLTGSQTNCDPDADPNCVQRGSPWCPETLLAGRSVCLQRLVLSTVCLPLFEEGDTLDRTDVCYDNGGRSSNNATRLFKVQFPLTVCPSRSAWDTTNQTDCLHYDTSPDRVTISLTELAMTRPMATDGGRVPLEAQLFDQTQNDFVADGLSSVIDFASGGATHMETTLEGIPTFQSDRVLTLVSRVAVANLRPRLPVAIVAITLCRGAKGTVFSRAAELMGSSSVSTSNTCGGVSDQLSVLSNQAIHQACLLTQGGGVGPCLEPDQAPKPRSWAQSPEHHGGADEAISSLTVCQSELGCDGFSIPMSTIEASLGSLEDDEIYFIETEVFVGQYYSDIDQTRRRRRLLHSSWQEEGYLTNRVETMGLMLVSGRRPSSSSSPYPPPVSPGDSLHFPQPIPYSSTNHTTDLERWRATLVNIQQSIDGMNDESCSQLNEKRDDVVAFAWTTIVTSGFLSCFISVALTRWYVMPLV